MSLESSSPRGRISTLVAAGRLDEALRAIERIVDDVFCEQLNTAEIFADAGLDAACQAIGAASLVRLGPAPAVTPGGPPVFIASMLQRSGGHTAVLADIARHTGQGATVLLTGVAGPTRLDKLAHLFRGIEPLRFEQAPRGDRAGKLAWLQSRLRTLAPLNVWLVNHHADSVAVAAVQPDQGYLLKYLHHGDHHLCLGVTLPFGEHYDPHAMGLHNCREVLRRPDNRYLPMAVPPGAPAPEVAAEEEGPLVTCTAAGSNKIEHAYWPAYADVVAELLVATGGTHVHIGALSCGYRWRMQRALARHGVDPARLRYIPFVPSVSAAVKELGVDLYLSSFPYAGARTLIEVMSAGIPTAAHDHNGSRFLSAMDMLPPGSCVWSRPEELVTFVQGASRSDLQALGSQALAHYERFHTPAAMQAALDGNDRATELPSSPFLHRPDLLLQGLRRAREVSFSGLFIRLVRRWGRRVRASLA